jgi:uncharacterized protein (DUF362 family)
MVRNCFLDLKYDEANAGTKNWNPLKEFIKKGDFVVLKPNLVMDFNPSGEGTDCLYTHPSIVAAVADYVIKAMEGEGTIVIGDAPMQECNFEKLIEDSGYKELLSYYESKVGKNIKIFLKDFREVSSISKNGFYEYSTFEDKGVVVKLDEDSEFHDLTDKQYNNLRITNYDPAILKEHHNSRVNEYYVSKWILNADVIINLPKPKTHRKAGVTISMKNLVGINARKEYLPHHTNGSIDEQGDCYKKHSLIKQLMNYSLDKKNYYSQTKKAYLRAQFYRAIVHFSELFIERSKDDPYFQGSWFGNDTISRTIVDLNKILFFANRDGKMKNDQQRKYLIIADMIIAGHKEGPVMPSAFDAGLIATGENPLYFDEVIAHLMGAYINKIPTIQRARKCLGKYSFSSIDKSGVIVSNEEKWNGKRIKDLNDDDLLYFLPTSGWISAFKLRV